MGCGRHWSSGSVSTDESQASATARPSSLIGRPMYSPIRGSPPASCGTDLHSPEKSIWAPAGALMATRAAASTKRYARIIAYLDPWGGVSVRYAASTNMSAVQAGVDHRRSYPAVGFAFLI